MKAMILAAGLGTRLRPLTDMRPKALMEVGGRTLLEIALSRLHSFGIRDVIINTHHFSGQIVDCLRARDNFGMRIEISHEEVLLDTGGGLKKAANFFLRDPASSGEPFILHNVDVISNIDLRRMVEVHLENRALATLAVQERSSSRSLLFDDQLQLCGRKSAAPGATGEAKTEMVRDSPRTRALAFCGIHAISPRIFPLMTEGGVFSIIAPYLRLAGRGEKILGFRADEYRWRDLGRLDDLMKAEQDGGLSAPFPEGRTNIAK
jgi:mannose-1-phosphate guanylyltransferase